MPLIEKPSQLPIAVGQALRAAFPELRVGSPPGILAADETDQGLVQLVIDGAHLTPPSSTCARPADLL